ncbi:MAG: hypothetical protein GJ680_07735 [Alteromonadaceae bacterium]|nr:hypothetical protein [Alteromonadaceae bacterium]
MGYLADYDVAKYQPLLRLCIRCYHLYPADKEEAATTYLALSERVGAWG